MGRLPQRALCLVKMQFFGSMVADLSLFGNNESDWLELERARYGKCRQHD